MGKVLHCADFGVEGCDAVFRGETVEAVLEEAKRHGMEVHGQTAEQVDSPEVSRLAAEKARDDGDAS